MSAAEFLDPEECLKWINTGQHSHSITEELSEELLEPSPRLTWDLLELVQSVPDVNKQKLFEDLLIQPEAIHRTSFRFKRGGIEGSVTGFQEELRLSEVDNANATNSLSINRRLGAKLDAVQGKSNYLPFQPGGILNKTQTNQSLKKLNVNPEFQFLHKNDQGLFDIPQGMLRGLDLGESSGSQDGIVALGQETTNDEDFESQPSSKIANDSNASNIGESQKERKIHELGDIGEIDDYQPLDYKMLQHKMDAEADIKHNWAHVVDLNHKIENFDDIVPNMARKWPFELDTFQKEAVYHLEQGDSVFVAAHTSAGKTVVAEYAIAMAARNMTKTIYTSPIKALSNQKFRDFKETFKDMDIGLITGDVQINPDANCLIMTTEILRSMLYRGADLIRDVEFVIFDEVHYVNDIERGVVWEEVIIMLPDHVKYILLSATVPNTFEFANWVGRTKQKDIYVISTPKRPVPLEIFIWAKNDLFKAINANGVFSESEFKKHRDLLMPDTKEAPPNVTMGAGSRKGPGGTARGGNRGGGRGRGISGRGGRGGMQAKSQFARDGPNKSTWIGLVQYLNEKKLLPVVIFVFSKKRCEDYVDTLSGVNFCTARERSEIHMFIDRAVARLKKEDRELPQILKIRDLLSRGIAVHHGGLLPIVKECIEILFSKSLIKVLFATETFAMGLNLPTRTVVFCELRKHDGRGFRNLFPGEFTQMAGRAGRRGLDTTGTVIVMSYKHPLQPADFKDVTMGKPTKLLSQFRLTYNMILNLLRIEALRVEEMIKHSFSENSTQTLLPEHKIKVEELSETLRSLTVEETAESKEFQEAFGLMAEYKELYTKIVLECQELSSSRYQVLRFGKLMLFEDEDEVLRFGILLKIDFANQLYIFLTFNHGKEYEDASRASRLPYIPNKDYLRKNLRQIKYDGDLRVTSVPYGNVQFASVYTLKVNTKAILNNDPDAVKEAVLLFRMMIHYQSKLKEVSFSRTVQLSLHQLVARKDELLKKFSEMTIYNRPEFAGVYSRLLQRNTIEKKIENLNLLISDENLELLPDYEQRLRVLEQLDFIDKNQNVVLKGRVACEINSGWELVLTELILDNFLGDFEPEEIVALLSCFVYEGRSKDEEDPPLTPRLEKGKTRILQITERLLKIYNEHQVSLTSEEEEFLTRKRFALMNVVYEWARGLTFSEIMQISVELEGTIVRVITRLDEICRQVKNAALIVGDSMLHSKMSEAQERIKRDIVFCASLYI
ncbi:antiviral helicase [Metschnikowia bicuspidata var. bicuspidata NRRL YB-4993]|uniref:Antiviral helicase n=1 Tax=Metschnikowia bicuspidata var. bicuspidata NRRL YB-4993 TaxID=869754 RepID=A0A1A0H7F0_9ASCO|nr:antiviral helicase [Metschnikowia bicuspidata var. bicuspidata NRRL YB-4993]OBA19905.1 antiviral helicase [Metschnikowia bicuspidata var. bicuspidata NRRL YB-4993]